MSHMPRSGHALDVFIARDYLAKYPTHIAKLIANSSVKEEESFDRCIRSSARKLVQSVRVIYPKRFGGAK